jgi:hypothetical protein
MGVTKYVLPVVVGAMSGIILITLGEMGIQHIYPLPAGIHLNDKPALAAAMSQMPFNAFLLLLVNYLICSFVAGIASSLVAGRRTAQPAVVVGIALTLAGLFNSVTLPQPLSFSIISIVAYLPMAYAGFLAVRKR